MLSPYHHWWEASRDPFICRERASEIENFTDREPSTRELRKDFQNLFTEISQTEHYAKQNE